MNALDQLDEAFQAVKEFADQFSGSQDIRLMLVELLRAASRDEEAREQLEKLAGDSRRAGTRRRPEAARRLQPSTPTASRRRGRRPRASATAGRPGLS